MEYTVLQKVPLLWYPVVSNNIEKKGSAFSYAELRIQRESAEPF